MFECIEKDLEVNRSNKKLLEKLVEISKGKHVTNNYFKSNVHIVRGRGLDTLTYHNEYRQLVPT
jgi:hypothetical protein